MSKNQQQIIVTNVTVDITETLQARTKDPLNFLALQYKTGEFEAENGGALANVTVESTFSDVIKIETPSGTTPIDSSMPLEAAIEREDPSSGDAAAWNDAALEYQFRLKTSNASLKADSYTGFSLDWFDFDLETINEDNIPDEVLSVTPTGLHFRGAPNPRWWYMEDGDAYFDSPRDSEPNILSALLPEFFYLDVENWYTAPTPVKSGGLRKISKVTVTDSFDVETELLPSNAKDAWKVFALDRIGNKNGLSGEYLFVPNVAINVLHNDQVEEVRFVRDEQVNVVWAWEQLYTLDDGSKVHNGDGLRVSGSEQEPAVAINETDNAQGPEIFREFKLANRGLPNCIPYLPRFITPDGGDNGDIYLRRGRTLETATLADPQYKSKLVSESKRINEEEIPKTGLRVRRMKRFARGSDGQGHFWTGRHRDAGRGYTKSGLKFDQIVDKLVDE